MLSHGPETDYKRFATFPQFSLEEGGIPGPRYKNLLTNYSDWSGDLLDRLQHPDKQEHITAVKFQLRDVGIRDYVSGMGGWDELVRAVRKEGLDLCPQLTAPELARLNADIIGEGEYVDILSKPIADRYGYRSVFGLYRRGGGLELGGFWAGREWNPGGLVVGRLR